MCEFCEKIYKQSDIIDYLKLYTEIIAVMKVICITFMYRQMKGYIIR